MQERQQAGNNFITNVIGIWPDGWHRNTARITHEKMIYDFKIDNTYLNKEETAKQIIEAFTRCQQPTAFAELYKKYCE